MNPTRDVVISGPWPQAEVVYILQNLHNKVGTEAFHVLVFLLTRPANRPTITGVVFAIKRSEVHALGGKAPCRMCHSTTDVYSGYYDPIIGLRPPLLKD